MFRDEVSKNTLKKRRKYYLKHGVKNVFPSGLLESSFLDIKGEPMNKYPLKNFIELEEEPLVESLLLEDLPKELVRKIYGKEYIDARAFVVDSLPGVVDIYSILKDYVHIDIHKASFRKVEREDFLELMQTNSLPEGSIIYGEYKGISIILIKSVYGWKINIAIDSSKIQRWTKRSIEEYFKSLNIDKKELKDDIYTPLIFGGYHSGAFLDKLDNISIFICSGPTYERNFKFKSAKERKALQKEFNSILLDNNIDLDKVHEDINDVFDIEYLSGIAYEYVPYTLEDRYVEWRTYRIEDAEYRIVNSTKYALDHLNNSRKALSNARKEFKLNPSTKNKKNFLKLKQHIKAANDEYLNSTLDGKDYSYFDRIGCYFILKAFINKIKQLNASLGTQWEKDDKNNSILSNLIKYISLLGSLQSKKEYDFKFYDLKSLDSIPEWKDIDKKIDNVLSDSLKKAQELADKIKNDDITDTEYNVLNFVVKLVENTKYKLQTTLKLTQSMKEDLNEDLNMNEDIEKHEELNPLLFENDELKLEIKEAIEKIVNQFVEDLKVDGVKIEVKDIILVGSNVSYNYTKDSDLDIHIVADSESLDCNPEVYTLLYGAYRSLFNKNYDITIKGIPVEIYVEIY